MAAQTPPKTLLVVEDYQDTREMLAFMLRRAGYAVETAENGAQALDRLRAGPRPDLVLLDMLLPILDGWHLLSQIQRDPVLSGVPVVVTTGTILTREWAVQSGCAGFVKKPVEYEELLAEVGRCLC